jgi:predicted O-linked N-acetylglucosamine transferase (SPINDLY family)
MEMTSEQLVLVEDLIGQEKYSQVIDSLEQLIEVYPENLNYYWYLGFVYLLQENEELAQGVWYSILLQGNVKEIDQWTQDLIIFLEEQINKNIALKKLGNAMVSYQAILTLKPEQKNIFIETELIEALYDFALKLEHNKEYEEASNIYKRIISIDSVHFNAVYRLAYVNYEIENYEEVIKLGEQLIEIKHNLPQGYYVLGLVLDTQKNLNSITQYKKAIECDSNFFPAYEKLGDIYSKQNNFLEAAEAYQKGVSVAPYANKSKLFLKIAEVYTRQKIDDAAALNFGYYEYAEKKYTKAVHYFEKFLDKNFSNEKVINVHLLLGRCYILTNQYQKAVKLTEDALALFPNNLALERLAQSILPVIYKDDDEIVFYRNRFSIKLEDLIAKVSGKTKIPKDQIVTTINTGSNYFLGFQAKNDLFIQQKYAYFLIKCLSVVYPNFSQQTTIKGKTIRDKIRIGFISARLATLGKLYLGWIKNLNKSKFEIYTYDISGKNYNTDKVGEEIIVGFKNYSEKILFLQDNIEEIYSTVVDDKLDMLIIPEVGLDLIMQILCCLRLAPVQCVTWAHPMTTGSPNIDYFLSNDLMEPDDASNHYSEKLVRLPNLGFVIEPPTVPEQTQERSDFKIDTNDMIYLCCQSLPKYLPAYDCIFPRIAKLNSDAKFIFFDPFLGSEITTEFKKRLKKVFEKYLLCIDEYCIFLPKRPYEEYMMIHKISDVFLDSFGWSGGITSIDAIACDLPIVTCPGNLMRSRQSYAMLNMIGVTETIAKDIEEYVKIAVKLGTDNEFRLLVKNKIFTNKHKLFRDMKSISALEIFIESAVRDGV